SFVFIVVGRSELFTENFLVPIAGLEQNRRSRFKLAELWLVSPILNVLGATTLILVLTAHGVLPYGCGTAFRELVAHYDTLSARTYRIWRLDELQSRWDVARLPYTLRILLENVLRNGTEAEVGAVAGWVAADEPSREISFMPARVLLQDFTGVPSIVDLAAMRDAMRDQGGDPAKINPLIPSELVIDHSVQVDEFGSRFAIARNAELEFQRSRERS